MSVQASIEIRTISVKHIELFDSVKNSAKNNGLKYYEISGSQIAPSVTPVVGGIFLGILLSGIGKKDSTPKNIKIVATISAITAFLVQIQPTIQEAIKANASKGITVICGDKKIEIQGENDIEKAILVLKEIDCESNIDKLIETENKDNK